MSTSTPELLDYRANCHCGAITLTVRIPSLCNQEIVSCSCSICTRNGYLFVFPKREDVVFRSGSDLLVSYFFGKKAGAHKFCPTCGSSVLCDFAGYDMLGVNVSFYECVRFPCTDNIFKVRMFQEVDLKELKYKEVDGKALKPEYQVKQLEQDPEITDVSTTASELIPYPANCHCGAVKFTVRVPSLTNHKVNSCNCSICDRNGYLLLYPEREKVTFYSGHDNLSSYLFGTKRKPHKFCPNCGSSVFIDFQDKPWLGINVSFHDDWTTSVLYANGRK